MSLRGSGKPRGRPRGSGVSRGGGRGGRGGGTRKTQIWEWENYTPGPEVYDSLFRLREAPPVITPNLPNDCPIPNAQSRILECKQTRDEYARSYYVVLIRLPPRDLGDGEWREKIREVDISRILKYVSQRELERFELNEHREKMEIEAVAARAEAEERARKRLEKNTRPPSMRHGSKMVGGLGLDDERQPAPRGRPRGRGYRQSRGRGRRRRHEMPMLPLEPKTSMDAELDELANVDEKDEIRGDMDTEEQLKSYGEIEERIIPESEEDEDEENEENDKTSPMMRSSFITGSALATSPAALRRSSMISGSPVASFSAAVRRGQPEVPDIDDSDFDDDNGSVSNSASEQMINRQFGEHVATESDSEAYEDSRAIKRRRTENVSISLQASVVRLSSERSNAGTPLRRDFPPDAPIETFISGSKEQTSNDDFPASHPQIFGAIDTTKEQDGGSEEDEEYVVEAILEHSYQDGIMYYLVKWEDYGEASDWLPEHDLDGAAEMVAEYKNRLKRRRGKRPER